MTASLAREARLLDPERYALSLFYPEKARPHVWALLAFYGEIARIPERTSDEMLGLIRLAWWREAIEDAYAGKPPRSAAVAPALHGYIQEFTPPRLWFDALFEAREEQMHAPRIPDQATFERFALGTSGMLARLMLRTATSDIGALEQAAKLGALYGRIGLLRSTPHQLRQGYLLLPETRLREYGLSPETLGAGERAGWHEFCNRYRDEMLQECLTCEHRMPLNVLLWTLCRMWLRRLERSSDPFSTRFPTFLPYLPLRLAWRSMLSLS